MSSVSDCGSVKYANIELLSWEDCDTLGKQIGYIASSSIKSVVTNTFLLVRKVVQIFHLGEIANYVLKSLKWTKNQFYNVMEKIAKTPIFKSAMEPLTNGVKFIYEACIVPVGRVLKFIPNFLFEKILCNLILVPLNSYVITPLFRKNNVPAAAQSNTQNSYLKTFSDWTLLPLYNHVASPILNVIKKIGTKAINVGLKVAEPICKSTIVPIFNYAIIPTFHVIMDVMYGALSGGIKNKEPKKEEEKPPQSFLEIVKEAIKTDS